MQSRYDVEEVVYGLQDRLRAELDKRNMSIRSLSKQMGYNYYACQGWISGKRTPRLDSILLLCNVLDMSVEELLGVK